MKTNLGYRALTAAVVTFIASSVLLLSPFAFAKDECAENLGTATADITAAQIEITRIQEEETARGVTPLHQTKALLVKKNGQVVKTPITVVITHGLLNSPAFMQKMAERAHALGFNVINSRLPSHFEGTRSALDDFKGEAAVTQGLRIADIAQKLGSRVVYVGHSTGGTVSFYQAINNMDTTAGMILFSPCLRVSTQVQNMSSGLSTIGISGWLPEIFQRTAPGPMARYMSTWAGVEVTALADRLAALGAFEDNDAGNAPYGLIRQRLNDLPILWFDTAADETVDISVNAQVAGDLERTTRTVYPLGLLIRHDSSYTEAQDASTAAGRALNDSVTRWVEFLKRFK